MERGEDEREIGDLMRFGAVSRERESERVCAARERCCE